MYCGDGLTGLPDHGMPSVGHFGQGLASVLEKMPAVGHLDRLWGSFSTTPRVLSRAITADHLDLWLAV
jgi:hypothetical protein